MAKRTHGMSVAEPISATAGRRITMELAAATAFAALTAVGARLQLQLPFTPVPVTGQVLCVLLAGGVLGARLGFVSQVEYLAAGAAGLPVFAYGGGPPALLGPTAGYLVGFPLAALAVGALSGRKANPGAARALAACLGAVAVIYLFGAAWYAIWSTALGHTTRMAAILAQSVFPFVPVDAAKAVLAAALFPSLRRRLPFA